MKHAAYIEIMSGDKKGRKIISEINNSDINKRKELLSAIENLNNISDELGMWCTITFEVKKSNNQ